MAVPHDRSMNHELILGAMDGTFKSMEPDRGGIVEPTTSKRRQSWPWYYGYPEQDLEQLGGS